MKKNLISVLILAFCLINLILTSIMMFTTMGAVKKTSNLVTSIATVLNIELESATAETEATVSIGDIVTYDIADTLTIPLKHEPDDEKDHYCIVNVSLMMNSKHEDYATYQPNVETNSSLFKSIVIDVIGSHTLSELQEDPEGIRNEILSQIQGTYNSTFIYKIAFSNIMYQ